MSFMSRIAPVAALTLALSTPLVARAQTLKVGDPAPQLTVSKWVKGAPVKSLADGKVHVVEFWATWCGPCKTSIPHLTELAKQFKGKADFTGVSVWEQDQTLVAPFVKQMGDKMNYNVAMDIVPAGAKGGEGAMAKGWMTAAGQNGIPTAFVVDKTGKIAWIGHPMDNLDGVVSKVIAGSFDARAEADRKAAEQAQQAALVTKAKGIMALVQSGKTDEAMTQYAALKQENPALALNFAMGGLYPTLINADGKAAQAFAKQLSENEAKGNAMMLNALAWPMVAPDSKLTNPDYALAVSLAEQAVAAGKKPDPMIMDTLATAYFKNGDKAKAIETEAKAVALLNADPTADAATKKEMTERLAEFKKG